MAYGKMVLLKTKIRKTFILLLWDESIMKTDNVG